MQQWCWVSNAPKGLSRVKKKLGRNETCNCSSGKKYKYCCLRGEKHISKTRIADLIEEAGFAVLEHDPHKRDQAEVALRQLIQDRRATPNDRINASFTLVQIAQRRGDHNGALQQLEEIKVGPDDSAAKWHVVFLRAISLTQLGEQERSAELFDQLLASPAAKDEGVAGWWKLEAGRTYSLAGRREDARRVWTDSIEYFSKKPDEPEHLVRARANLAILMLDSDDETEVAAAERELEATCDMKIALGDWEGASTNFSQLSMHFFLLGNFEKAIAYGRKDLKLSRFIGNERMIASTLMNMSQVYARALQLSDARSFVDQALKIGTRLDNPEIIKRCGQISTLIEKIGKAAGMNRMVIGKGAKCACGSGNRYEECCGRADHEPIALRTPIGGPSEDIEGIATALKEAGLNPLELDFAMRDTKQSRSRIAWSQIREHEGWFEILELPDMANMHLRAAESFAEQAEQRADAIHEPIACAMLAVSALEAFINTIAYFAHDASVQRTISLPPALLTDPFDYQRHTELTQKWTDLGIALCAPWPPPVPIWANFSKLLQIRNELVHYKAGGFSPVAPMGKTLPDQLRNLPPEVILRDVPGSWPVRLLTPSFSRWSVSVARDLIAYFRNHYRFAVSDKLHNAPQNGHPDRASVQ